MRKNLFYCLTGFALATGATATMADTASVATVPTGMITCAVPHSATSFMSLPLTNTATYTSSVTAVTNSTISVGDSPAPFTTSLSTATAPYFVKFLSGSEMGRVLLITGNTTSTLTLNITDNSSQTVNLTTTGFSVAAGDTFEIFPAATLATVFGNNTTQSPLALTGAANAIKADSVGVFNMALGRWKAYYFNTTAGQWETIGSTAAADNTVLYPYGALSITRRATSTATASVVLTGRVAEVPCITKTTGSNSVVYASTGYATDMTLSQLQFGSTWVTGTSPISASTLGIWNPTLGKFDTYFQSTDSTWRKSDNTSVDQSNLVLSAGTAISILQRTNVNGASSFLASVMPYTLN